MNLQPKHSVLLIGGQDAGKSNFLFRFWLRLQQEKGLLVRDGLPSEMEYLNNGAESLLKGKYAGHTSADVREECVIPVKTVKDGAQGVLTIPDCNGEKFNLIYQKREWGPEWDNLVVEGTGCLLFLRPNSEQIQVPLDWIQFHKLFTSPKKEKATDEEPQAESTAEAPAGDIKAENLATTKPEPEQIPVKDISAASSEAAGESEPTNADAQSEQNTGEPKGPVRPTQVVLVEWLQFLRQVFTAKVSYEHKPRIGIVVSAWDSVPPDQQKEGALKYLDANFPLISQFIATNQDRFDIQCFGVSVTGGDLEHMPGYKKTYIDGDPQNAGFIVHEVEGKVENVPDHTLPVAWALGVWPEQTK